MFKGVLSFKVEEINLNPHYFSEDNLHLSICAANASYPHCYQPGAGRENQQVAQVEPVSPVNVWRLDVEYQAETIGTQTMANGETITLPA